MSIEISLEVECSLCGRDLVATVERRKNYPNATVIVFEPCAFCENDRKKEAPHGKEG